MEKIGSYTPIFVGAASLYLIPFQYIEKRRL